MSITTTHTKTAQKVKATTTKPNAEAIEIAKVAKIAEAIEKNKLIKAEAEAVTRAEDEATAVAIRETARIDQKVKTEKIKSQIVKSMAIISESPSELEKKLFEKLLKNIQKQADEATDLDITIALYRQNTTAEAFHFTTLTGAIMEKAKIEKAKTKWTEQLLRLLAEVKIMENLKNQYQKRATASTEGAEIVDELIILTDAIREQKNLSPKLKTGRARYYWDQVENMYEYISTASTQDILDASLTLAKVETTATLAFDALTKKVKSKLNKVSQKIPYTEPR